MISAVYFRSSHRRLVDIYATASLLLDIPAARDSSALTIRILVGESD
jgi:hypothetical protein